MKYEKSNNNKTNNLKLIQFKQKKLRKRVKCNYDFFPSRL